VKYVANVICSSSGIFDSGISIKSRKSHLHDPMAEEVLVKKNKISQQTETPVTINIGIYNLVKRKELSLLIVLSSYLCNLFPLESKNIMKMTRHFSIEITVVWSEAISPMQQSRFVENSVLQENEVFQSDPRIWINDGQMRCCKNFPLSWSEMKKG